MPESMIVNYDKREINMEYSSIFDHIFSSYRVSVHGSGDCRMKLNDSDFNRKYSMIEETAQLYLIKDTLEKAEGRGLIGIFGLRQNIFCNLVNDCLEIEILLEGVARYKKIEKP